MNRVKYVFESDLRCQRDCDHQFDDLFNKRVDF